MVVKEQEGSVLVHYAWPRICERLAGEPKDACEQTVAAAASPHFVERVGYPLERVEAEKPDGEDVTATAVGCAEQELVLDTLREARESGNQYDSTCSTLYILEQMYCS